MFLSRVRYATAHLNVEKGDVEKVVNLKLKYQLTKE
jgi:hypothetical protein